MYENGGNVTQRFLDSHPELYVYPFESQLGNGLFTDYLSSMFPFKYRWPEFPATGEPVRDYELFYDEELKVRIRTPHLSKFRLAEIQLDEPERIKTFVSLLKDKPRIRANLIAAFFKATFETWRNLRRSGKEHVYVGYSPIVGVDAEKIFADFPHAHVLHVVRNPFSAYADTKRRPFPLSLHRYTITWNLVQHLALLYANKYPQNFHIVRYEDLVTDPEEVFNSLCRDVGISFTDTLLYPSWNGRKLDDVYPWGTIRKPTKDANIAALNSLSDSEKTEIRLLSTIMLGSLGYDRPGLQ